MGDSITEGTISSWEKQVGDYVNADDIIVIIETDKVSVDVRAAVAGALESQMAEEGDTVEVGKPLVKIDTAATAPAGGTPPAAAKEPEVAAATPAAATPAAAPAAPVTPAAPKAAAPVAIPVVSPTVGGRNENRIKMTRMRMRIAENLKASQNINASLTTFQETDMSALIAMRKEYKEAFEAKHGCKLGFMSPFVMAATKALQEIPAINARVDSDTNELVFHDFSDISIAVATPTGLVTPALRNTQNMSLADIEKQIADYGVKARAGKITLEDMTGGTFTISNGGTFGSLYGTPIINTGQSAVLGMHATKMRAVVNKDGDVVARPMMYLALTYDHRIVDGKEAVTFLKSIAEKIEDPRRLLLEL